jgi:hypothetical protein
MMIVRRVTPPILVMTLLAVPLVVLTSAPASAAGRDCTAVRNVEVCITVFTDGTGNYGGVFIDPPAYFKNATVYVRQCRPDITHCVTVSSNGGRSSPPGYIVYGVVTSTKPVSYGHIYHACASWTDNSGHAGVNVCSPWKSWP